MAERPSHPSVAIVGGGLAGLAAACALSENGFRVTVFERRPYLGGRASSYEHPGTREVVDNCQHVLFALCTNLIAFYRTIGIENKIRWFDRMTFIEPGGRQSVLEPTFLAAPLHVTPSFLRLKFLSMRDKLSVARGLAALIGPPSENKKKNKDKEEESFQDWLVRHRQTPAAIERFWKPILVSALSEEMDRIAVPYAAQVVRESMKSRNARRMGIPTVPLTHLYDAARDYISERGGAVRLRNSIQSFLPTERGVRLKLQDSEEEFDYAVLAVPFDSLARLLPDSIESRELREKLAQFETSPITGIHFWFDRKITDLPHAILLDRTIQWMFHKSQLLDKEVSLARGSEKIPGIAEQAGSSNASAPEGRNIPAQDVSPGYDNNKMRESRRDDRKVLEGRNNFAQAPSASLRVGSTPAYVNNALAPDGRNISAQDVSPGDGNDTTESRRDDTNSAGEDTEASYVELVISSSKSLIEKSRQEIIDLALKELREFFPQARDAKLVKATVIKEVNATFSPTPGIDRHRPHPQTVWPRVFLAGDWTATGWPATMEGAVRSGYLAAEAVAGAAGRPKKFMVPDLPPNGLMRMLK
jgi:squalene-associated FAD-dependent desaturase